MICALSSRSSTGETALTVACVPTGMNTGVSMVPWRVTSRPRRARLCGSVPSNVNIAAAMADESPDGKEKVLFLQLAAKPFHQKGDLLAGDFEGRSERKHVARRR